MKRRTGLWASFALVAATVVGISVIPEKFIWSADHLDPPGRTDPAFDTTPDTPADIADIYAFHDEKNLYLIYTFAGPSEPALAAFYDRDVLYSIKISTAAPATTAEATINFQFGPGSRPNEWGIKVDGIPGVNGSITGPVESIISAQDVRVYAGLRDDPFFFDSQGLRETRNTGTIQFRNSRSFFGGKNATVVALEIPRSRFGADGNAKMDIWAVSSRFGGQI